MSDVDVKNEIVEEVKEEEKAVGEGPEKAPETAPTPSPSLGKTFIVKVDTDIANIVELNDDEYKLIFETDKGKFKKLEKDIVDMLSKSNRERYFTARGIYSQNLEDKPTDGIKIIPNFASPTRRLSVEGKKAGKAYTWKRPDEIQRVKHEGGKVCKDPDVKTFANTDEDSTRHIVGSAGHVELYLCEYPEDAYKEIYVDGPGRQSDRMRKGTEESGVAALGQKGVAGFVDRGSENTGKNWSSHRSSEGE